MGIRFQGFFLTGDDTLGAELQVDWPTASVRRVTDPFEGWDVVLPPEYEEETYDVPGEAQEDRVLRWSQRMPGKTIIFLDADCFGGECL